VLMFVLVNKEIDKSYSLPVQNDHEPPMIANMQYIFGHAEK